MEILGNYKHHYSELCSCINNHAPRNKLTYKTWGDFYSEFCDADINMNMIFRWDVKREKGITYCDLYMLQQRKGEFVPIRIEKLESNEEYDFRTFLKEHWRYLKDIWEPISE